MSAEPKPKPKPNPRITDNEGADLPELVHSATPDDRAAAERRAVRVALGDAAAAMSDAQIDQLIAGGRGR